MLLAAAAPAVAAATALAGCAQFDAALGQRQAVVSFTDGTPVSQRHGGAHGLRQAAGCDRSSPAVRGSRATSRT